MVRSSAFILMLSVLSLPAVSAIYQCKDERGVNTFTDIPCDNAEIIDRAPLKENYWIDRLKRSKNYSINITSLETFEDHTLIKVNYRNDQQLEDFINLIRRLSDKTTSIVNAQAAKGTMRGTAAIQVI